MTPTEMRQQAARNRSRAAALDSAAARLRVIADRIRHLLSGLSQRSREVWRGPAASDFEARAEEADREVRTQAGVLADTAIDFEDEARRLRSAAAALEAQAAAAESAAVGVGGSDGGGGGATPPGVW